MYRAVKMRSPRLGVQAFVKSMCDIQRISIRPYVFQQFSIAYDVYIDILSGVSHQVSTELGRAEGGWRVRNCCPACNNRLEGEPKLLFSQLGCYDGNNSAKRIPRRTRESGESDDVWTSSERFDLRDGTAGYFLPRERVDRWENEAKQELLQPHIGPDVAEENPCAPRWYNMVHDKESKMWGIFDETGIFVALCRHGFILIAADMVKSGEL
jgi:hypothetical protein